MRRKIIYVFHMFLIAFFFMSGKDVFAYEQDNKVFSLEKDGYWKPTDAVSHDFYIKNEYDTECYLEGIYFENITIRDIENGDYYSIKEAKNMNILDAYSVLIKFEDDTVVFRGKLENLYEENLILSDTIFLQINEKVKFNMTIFMDDLAQDNYQNKNYQFIMYPKGYKVVYDEKQNSNKSESESDEKSQSNKFVENINKRFETGDKMIILIMYEIMFLFFLFLLIYRIRINKNICN